MLKTLKFSSANLPSLMFSRGRRIFKQTVPTTLKFKPDVTISWKRPDKIHCYKAEKAGDLSTLKFPDPNTFLFNYEKSEELQTADDIVKDVFKVDFNRRHESVAIASKEMTGLVRRHTLDWGSLETKSEFNLFLMVSLCFILFVFQSQDGQRE
jgi:hypothetical protein